MSKKTVKSGKVQANIQSDFDDSILELVRKAMPEGIEVFEMTLRQIEKEAKNNWIVRQPVKPVRDADGNIKVTKEGKPRIRKQSPSKRSIDKFRINAKITAKNEVEVFLENYSQYAWAIKPSIDSKGERGKELFLVQGLRIANELLVKPMRRNANKVVKKYTDAIMKLQK